MFVRGAIVDDEVDVELLGTLASIGLRKPRKS
jgi:hypothetical protein